MVTPTNPVIARPGSILRGALGTLDIFTTFSALYRLISKNVSLSERGAHGTEPYYGKSGSSYCITSIKRLDEGLR